MYRQAAPDIVVLDVVMPQVDGFKVTEVLKREAQFVPMILLTGFGDIKSKRRGLVAGADECLTKPVNLVEFLAWRHVHFDGLSHGHRGRHRRLAEVAWTQARMALPAIVRWTRDDGIGTQFLQLGARDTGAIVEFAERSVSGVPAGDIEAVESNRNPQEPSEARRPAGASTAFRTRCGR